MIDQFGDGPYMSRLPSGSGKNSSRSDDMPIGGMVIAAVGFAVLWWAESHLPAVPKPAETPHKQVDPQQPPTIHEK